ncbi:MAG: LuxR C-terminal-related transcriptional regulator [Acidimicrobiales bacterium]|jgi:DNA-binding NarL/FixJ family response regulator
METRIPVVVFASDSVSLLGTIGQLRAYPGITILEDTEAEAAEVAVVVVDRVDGGAVRVIRAAQRQGSARVVVVAGELDAAAVFDAVEAGACGFIRRSEARPETLAACVRRAAAGDGTVPPDLLGRLLDQVGMAQRQVLAPRGLSFSNLTKREIEVLRLLADGHNTAEVAHELVYSERTVKNVLADVTRRLSLRNRTHAVAYALRQGLI